jgi:uncharacterized protein with FMN-binding domain
VKTRAIVTSTLASVGVLVVGWQVGAAGITAAEQATSVSASAGSSSGSTSSGASSTTTDTTSIGTTSTGTSPSSTDTTAPAAPTTPTVVDGTYTGAAASTRWGDVQVAVTISGGVITDVTALQLTDADGKSVQISNRAAPILRDEVIAAQSADVANVGGATYTTQAYLTSVQSALDQAGL